MLVFALLVTGALMQRVQGLFPHATLIPASVMVLDGIPRGKIKRQHPPRNTPFDDL